MLNSDVVNREGSPEFFYIRQHITCQSRNVVYVVLCKRCNRIGVGECEFPKKRLVQYVRAAAKINTTSTSAVQQHFSGCPDHSILDLQFLLIDAIPATLATHPACWDGVRARLEEMWITKLGPTLNVKKQLRQSFTGFARARLDPAIDDPSGSQY